MAALVDAIDEEEGMCNERGAAPAEVDHEELEEGDEALLSDQSEVAVSEEAVDPCKLTAAETKSVLAFFGRAVERARRFWPGKHFPAMTAEMGESIAALDKAFLKHVELRLETAVLERVQQSITQLMDQLKRLNKLAVDKLRTFRRTEATLRELVADPERVIKVLDAALGKIKSASDKGAKDSRVSDIKRTRNRMAKDKQFLSKTDRKAARKKALHFTLKDPYGANLAEEVAKIWDAHYAAHAGSAHKGDSIKDYWAKMGQRELNKSLDTVFVCKQQNAWNSQIVFLDYISKVLVPAAEEAREDGQVLSLVLDRVGVHRTAAVTAALFEAGIDCFFIPVGGTGVLQPLDLSVNKSFKDDHLLVKGLSTMADIAEAGSDPNSHMERTVVDAVLALRLVSTPTIVSGWKQLVKSEP